MRFLAHTSTIICGGGPGNLFLNQVHPDTDVWSSRKSSFQWIVRIYQSLPLCSSCLVCLHRSPCRHPMLRALWLLQALHLGGADSFWSCILTPSLVSGVVSLSNVSDPLSVKVEWQSRPPGFPWGHLWGAQHKSRHGGRQSTLALPSCYWW